MKNLFKRLKRRSGFTLVECIVAIAVFAVMVMIVFMILSNAKAEASRANESEENLTKLIDNVVGDETYHAYKEERDAAGNLLNSLQLNITGSGVASGSTFDITYNLVNGYKNYVLCTNTDASGLTCNYFADNSAFMGSTEPEDFTQAAYVCPACGNSIVQTLVCQDCGATGSHTDAGRFAYMSDKGGYTCLSCNGATVSGSNISDYVDSDAMLSVNGIVPNAIVYGEITQPEAADRNDFVKFSGKNSSGGPVSAVNNTVQINLVYTPMVNTSVPGTYTLTVDPNGIPADIDIGQEGGYQITISFPPHYVFYNGAEAGVRELTPSVATCTPNHGGQSNENSSLTFHFAQNVTTAAQFQFQLVNYKSGYPFEYDYRDNPETPSIEPTGLAEFWFQIGNVSSDGSFNAVNKTIGSVSSS